MYGMYVCMCEFHSLSIILILLYKDTKIVLNLQKKEMIILSEKTQYR